MLTETQFRYSSSYKHTYKVTSSLTEKILASLDGRRRKVTKRSNWMGSVSLTGDTPQQTVLQDLNISVRFT